MPYNKRFLKYIIKNKIINGSPKFKLYRYDPSSEKYVLIKELQADCMSAETDEEIGAECTALDNSSDSYKVERIELHVNTYGFVSGGKTYSDTMIDRVDYTVTKGTTDRLDIADEVTFTSTGYAEV